MNDQVPATVDLQALLREANVLDVIETLDRELIGLAPVKQRIRDIAAYLVVSKARATLGLTGAPPSLHMSFIVNRPKKEPGFGVARTEGSGRQVHYRIHSYATDKAEGERY